MKQTRSLTTVVTKTDDPRVWNFDSSDGTVDRMEDVVEPKGWQLDTFRKSGPFLWGHDHDIPALGQAVSAQVQEGILKIGIKFTDSPRHKLAGLVQDLYKDGTLKSVSVGFDPLEWEPIKDTFGTRFLKQELLELSAVNVPANRNAVITNACKGMYCEHTRKGLHMIGLLPEEIINVSGLLLPTAGEPTEEPMKTPKPEIKMEDITAMLLKAQTKLITKGTNLGAFLSAEVDALVTEDQSRADIVSEIASAAGIDEGTVNQILDGSIECPPLDRLEGIAQALGLGMSSVIAAAEEDGCSYGDDDEAEEETEEEMGAEAANTRNADATGSENGQDCGCGKRRAHGRTDQTAVIRPDVIASAITNHFKESMNHGTD